MDGHVAETQKSVFFSTRAGDAATMRESIEGVEAIIARIDRQIGHATGRGRTGPALM